MIVATVLYSLGSIVALFAGFLEGSTSTGYSFRCIKDECFDAPIKNYFQYTGCPWFSGGLCLAEQGSRNPSVVALLVSWMGGRAFISVANIDFNAALCNNKLSRAAWKDTRSKNVSARIPIWSRHLLLMLKRKSRKGAAVKSLLLNRGRNPIKCRKSAVGITRKMTGAQASNRAKVKECDPACRY